LIIKFFSRHRVEKDGALMDAQQARDDSEKRAQEAENKVASLTKELENLRAAAG